MKLSGFFERRDRGTDSDAVGSRVPGRLTSRRLPGLIAALVVAFAMAAFLMPAPVSADSGGYTTPSFDVNVVTDEDHVFHVSEEIHVSFYEPRHGIYRYIPNGGRYYGIRDIKVKGYNYEVYEESGSTVIQIGDADYVVDGDQTYRITYDIVGYRDDSTDQDYLSLDLLPTGWNTEIDSANLRIEFPKEIDQIETFVGRYGSEEMSGYFDVNSTGTVYTAVSTGPVPQGVGLTIQADLPEGYWVNPYSRDKNLLWICGVLAVMGMLMLLLWLFVGRDNPIVQTVEFYPPEDMDPLEIAYVGNDEVKAQDISAQFMYMANKGYVQVESDGKKAFTLIRKNDPDPSERGHTKKLFRGLFSGSYTVMLRKLPENFGNVAAEIPGEVKRIVEGRQPTFSDVSRFGRVVGLAFCLLIPLVASLMYSWLTYGSHGGAMFGGFLLSIVMFLSMATLVSKTDSFRTKRTKKRTVRILLGGLIFLAAALLEAAMMVSDYPVMALVFLCSELAAAVATIFVRKRMNNELYGKVLGFREFIRTAEYDRLKMLSDEDPEYYFNIMPYACIFGMSTKWAKKFSDFKIPQPSWYTSTNGTWDPFFAHYMYMNTGHMFSSAVASHYRAIGADVLSSAVDSASHSGGFGGGGFSGGGFGGGGGGSW